MMSINKNKLLLAVILTLSLTVTTGVLAYDRYSAVWGDYGPMGTRCLAGVCANVQNNQLVNHQHWVGYETPCPLLGAYVIMTEKVSGATHAWTCGEVWYKSGGEDYFDSNSSAHIYV